MSSDLANISRRSECPRAIACAHRFRARLAGTGPRHDFRPPLTRRRKIFRSLDEPTTVTPKLPHTREGVPFRVLNLHTLRTSRGTRWFRRQRRYCFSEDAGPVPPDVNCSLTVHYRQAKGNSQNLFNIAIRVGTRQTSCAKTRAGRLETGFRTKPPRSARKPPPNWMFGPSE